MRSRIRNPRPKPERWLSKKAYPSYWEGLWHSFVETRIPGTWEGDGRLAQKQDETHGPIRGQPLGMYSGILFKKGTSHLSQVAILQQPLPSSLSLSCLTPHASRPPSKMPGDSSSRIVLVPYPRIHTNALAGKWRERKWGLPNISKSLTLSQASHDHRAGGQYISEDRFYSRQ